MTTSRSGSPFRLLLLENISKKAVESFRRQGFHVDLLSQSISEEELVKRIGTYHGVGIRSKTRITARVLENAPVLQVVACFCIGTDQVDIPACTRLNVPVFNSPFSNSRSVAELVLAQMVVLSRNLFDSSSQLPVWNKNSNGCRQILGKTLGIVGYGHIGSQLSVLAQAMGMQVLFYDIINPIMAFGATKQVGSLHELLRQSDFVSLHVPSTPNLISYLELREMKKTAYLINDSRGNVVDLPALVAALECGQIAGAAIDVYPNEPSRNGQIFDDPLVVKLRGMKNVLLTPHIGGSTEEAQSMIGDEVAAKMGEFLVTGGIHGAVNEVALKEQERTSSAERVVPSMVNILARGTVEDYAALRRRESVDIAANTTRSGLRAAAKL